MAGTSDKVFLRAFKWFRDAVIRLQAELPSDPPVDLSAALTDILRTKLGLQLDKTEATIDPSAFAATRAEAHSLAVATMITGETLTALRTLGEVLAALGAGALALDDLSKVIQQIDRMIGADPGKPPSAYSIAKLLLILSGDADEPDSKPPARKLVLLLTNNPGLSDAQVAEPQMILGLAIMAVGTILDRSFDAGGLPALPPPMPIALPPASQHRTFSLARSDDGSKKLDLALGVVTGGETRLFAELASTLATQQAVGDAFELQFSASAGFRAQFSVPTLVPLPVSIPKPDLSGAIDIGIAFARKSSASPLVLGSTGGTHFSIGELSGGIVLKNNAPQVVFDLKDSKLVLKIGDDSLLSAVMGDAIEVRLTFGLVADAAGVRLKDGTGLKATIPLEKIPNSPVQIPFLYFDLIKGPNLNQIDIEIAGSFQVAIGPFAGSIDRLGTKLNLGNMLGGGNPLATWGLKPPSGAGLAIDAGVIKGGGFLLFDPDRGEYGGILDIKLMQIGVKAIGLLSTKNPGGWSLLLIITAQLPPIQLGFGFTMTGIGGLLGVQHTIATQALSSGLSTGSLDSFLFPQNPIANAPQIINQLRTIFPFSPGGFVIGPMLELGWGTPSLVTARLGVLIEVSQLVIVGQVIVAAAAARRQIAGASVPADGHRRRRRVRPAQDLVRRVAARLARALHLADRPVRVPCAVRRPAEFSDQRRRLPSALHRYPARHSGAVPAGRRRVLDRHRRHALRGLLRSDLCHRAGRLGDARVGRRRHRSVRGRLRVQRHHLHRSEVPLRSRHPRLGRCRGVRHRLRKRRHLRPARGPGSLAHRRQGDDSHAVAAAGLQFPRRRDLGRRPRNAGAQAAAGRRAAPRARSARRQGHAGQLVGRAARRQ